MHILRSSLITALWGTRKSLGKTCLFMFSLKTRELIWTRTRKGSKWNRTVESNRREHDDTQLMRHQVSKLIKKFVMPEKQSAVISVRGLLESTLLCLLSSKNVKGIPQSIVTVQMSVPFWPISECWKSGHWSRPSPERLLWEWGSISSVSIYTAPASIEAKRTEIFPAIRPGNGVLEWIKFPFSRVRTYPDTLTTLCQNQCNATQHVVHACVWCQVGILCRFVRRLLQFSTLWFDPYSYKKILIRRSKFKSKILNPQCWMLFVSTNRLRPLSPCQRGLQKADYVDQINLGAFCHFYAL